MKIITHLQLHQSVRARFLDRTNLDNDTIADVVEATLDELDLDVFDGLIVHKSQVRSRARRRR